MEKEFFVLASIMLFAFVISGCTERSNYSGQAVIMRNVTNYTTTCASGNGVCVNPSVSCCEYQGMYSASDSCVVPGSSPVLILMAKRQTTASPTGYAVSNYTTTHCCRQANCIDPDGGNTYIKGTTTGNSNCASDEIVSATDYCNGNQIYEFLCSPNFVISSIIDCQYGCYDGTCQTSPPCADLDSDGYGNPASPSCVHPELDCNDTNNQINPGATEICGNGIDENCMNGDLACSACSIGNAIPATGCTCSGINYYSGYCCPNGWQTTPCEVLPQITTIQLSGMGNDALLGIPRRKMVQSGDKIWIFTAGGGADGHYSANGGQTWSNIQYLSVGDHDSFDIDSTGNIHTGQRQINGNSSYKRIDSPAASLSDYHSSNDESFYHFPGGPQTASAILAFQNYVFMFTRASFITTIYYDMSSDYGLTWNSSGVLDTNLPSGNRIGAMIIDNMAYAVVWEQMSIGADKVIFYRWNGIDFNIDHSLNLTLEIVNPLTRVFSFTQAEDGNVHVAYWNTFGGTNRIRHTYKKRTDASWSVPVTIDDCNTDGLISITAHGNNIYAAYLRPNEGFNVTTYRKFDGVTKTWGNRIVLESGANCRYPSFPKKADPSLSYVPLAWTKGTGLYYTRIPA